MTTRVSSRFLEHIILEKLKYFWRSRKGSVAIISALGLPVLILMVGGTVDYARLITRKSQLQDAVDTGVLTGGNALKLAGSNRQTVAALTERTIHVTARPIDEAALTVSAEVLPQNDGVHATAQEKVKLYFGGLIGVKYRIVSVNARSTIVGRMRLCMLTTDDVAAGALSLMSDARVTAVNCALYTDSSSSRALVGEANAVAHAEMICSVGGVDGPRANFNPHPNTDCPVIKDPLRGRTEVRAGPCKSTPSGTDPLSFLHSVGIHVAGLKSNTNLTASLSSQSRQILSRENRDDDKLEMRNKIAISTTLDPGTYCGGLLITGSAVVNLRPGTYIFKDGPLLVEQTATLNGQNVSLHFTGNEAGLLFNTNTTISLTAPTGGLMGGILMSDDEHVSAPVDPAVYLNAWNKSLGGINNCPLSNPPVSATPAPLGQQSPMRIYRIISNNTRQMLGTIHLPAGRLVLDGQRPVADQSMYTVVVARQVNLYKGPNLVLNANYDRSNVPVPPGVGPITGQVRLAQ